jgi:hypothetical protein
MIRLDANTSRLMLALLAIEKHSEATPQDMCDLAEKAIEVRGGREGWRDGMG